MSPNVPRTEQRQWLRLSLAAEEEVKALLKALPAPVREKVAPIPIVFEAEPSPEMVEDGTDPDLMGLFLGNAYEEGGLHPEPTQILLFLRNIWEEVEHDTAEYRLEVRKTLLHEIGHFLGLGEDDLGIRDLE